MCAKGLAFGKRTCAGSEIRDGLPTHASLTREVRYSVALIGFLFFLDGLERMAD